MQGKHMQDSGISDWKQYLLLHDFDSHIEQLGLHWGSDSCMQWRPPQRLVHLLQEIVSPVLQAPLRHHKRPESLALHSESDQSCPQELVIYSHGLQDMLVPDAPAHMAAWFAALIPPTTAEDSDLDLSAFDLRDRHACLSSPISDDAHLEPPQHIPDIENGPEGLRADTSDQVELSLPQPSPQSRRAGRLNAHCLCRCDLLSSAHA